MTESTKPIICLEEASSRSC